MKYRYVPWIFIALANRIAHRVGIFQRSACDSRLMELHARLTEVPLDKAGVMPTVWTEWFNGVNPLDAIGCWFLLLLLHDREWGLRLKATTPDEIQAIDCATTLLRRWLEGDPTESREWKELLPKPEDLKNQSDRPSVQSIVAAMARVMHFENATDLLDGAAHLFLETQLPGHLARPFSRSSYDLIVEYLAASLVFPVVLWRTYSGRPRHPINRQYYKIAARTLEQLMQLRWNSRDEDEARLFARVLGRQDLDLLPEYLDRLRQQYVEPNEIADAEEILRRMSNVAQVIGLEFQDDRYVTGMPIQRLYSLQAPPPPFLMAFRQMHFGGRLGIFPLKVSGNDLQLNDEITRSGSLTNWQKFEAKQNELVSWGCTESRESQSRRVFVRTQPQEYRVTELHWQGITHWNSEAPDTDIDPAFARLPTPPNAFRVSIRSGPWPTTTDVWNSDLDQNLLWMEFPTRSSAMAWYRQEIERQRQDGFTEVLPRRTYFSSQARSGPVLEGKVVFDSTFPSGSVEAIWIEKQKQLAFLPEIAVESGAAALSKFAGEILVPEEEGWPNCPACKRPLKMLIQLNLDLLPAELQQRYGSGLLQFFHCPHESDCRGERGPFTETQLGRILKISEKLKSASSPEQVANPPMTILGWRSQADYPTRDAYYELDNDQLNQSDFYEVDREELLSKRFPPIQDDKLAGWPAFVPGVDVCPECSERLRLIYQMHSSGPIRFTIFEDTIGLLLQCPKHPSRIALTTWTK